MTEKFKMDNELSHYGVPGMKWGVRKDGRPQGYSNNGFNISKNKSKKTIGSKKSKAIKKMSDAELNSKINRIQKERQYKDLTATKIQRAKKLVSKVLATAVVAVATTATQKAIKKILKEMGDNYLKPAIDLALDAHNPSELLDLIKIIK